MLFALFPSSLRHGGGDDFDCLAYSHDTVFTHLSDERWAFLQVNKVLPRRRKLPRVQMWRGNSTKFAE